MRQLWATARRWRGSPPLARDGWVLAVTALVVRLGAVAWAAGRFPPVADGHFYHVVAQRIADGHGYTWAWPDGVVTYAAHYPVGYPALVGGAYAAMGPEPWVAMLVNALIGALSVLSVHRLAAEAGCRIAAVASAALVALHPALVLYTPALMTEGVTASLYVIAAAEFLRPCLPRRRRLVAGGIVTGIATLVRPQALLLAPVFAWFGAPASISYRLRWAVLACVMAIGVCLPWSLRNCERMGRCMLVSANGGWNLFIGAAPKATGSWVALETLGCPDECRAVFDEAEKDRCFGNAALHHITEAPVHWLSLVPSKLASTFDYGGAAGWYLNESNPLAFGNGAKLWLGAAETVYTRLALLMAAYAVFKIHGPRARGRARVLAIAALSFLTPSAWIGYLGITAAIVLLGRRATEHPPAAATLAIVGTTALVHSVFFGAGRYGLVCYPVLCALAGTAFAPGPRREAASP